jgi:hypothetical protein
VFELIPKASGGWTEKILLAVLLDRVHVSRGFPICANHAAGDLHGSYAPQGKVNLSFFSWAYDQEFRLANLRHVRVQCNHTCSVRCSIKFCSNRGQRYRFRP